MTAALRRAALPVPPPACLSAWTRCALLPGPDAIVPASPRSRRPRDTRPALSRARGQPRDSTRCASVWSPGPHVLCGFSQERAPLPRPVAPATGRARVRAPITCPSRVPAHSQPARALGVALRSCQPVASSSFACPCLSLRLCPGRSWTVALDGSPESFVRRRRPSLPRSTPRSTPPSPSLP